MNIFTDSIFMAILISLLSWMLRAYGAIQAQRNSFDKPLIWHSPIANLILILAWVGLLILSGYISFLKNGLGGILIILLLYFFSYPVFLGKLFTKLINRLGL